MRRLVLGFALATAGALLFYRREQFVNLRRPRQTCADAKQDLLEERTAPATVDEAPAASVDELERSTRAQLYQRAQAADIAGRSEMTKAQLIAALRAHGATGDTTTA